jgi:hypothetical protein
MECAYCWYYRVFATSLETKEHSFLFLKEIGQTMFIFIIDLLEIWEVCLVKI